MDDTLRDNPTKKDREILAVRRLINMLPGVTLKHIEAREEPDSLVTLTDGTKLGVEVVGTTDQQVASGEAALDRMSVFLEASLRDAQLGARVHLRTNEGLLLGLASQDALRKTAAATVALVQAHLSAGRGHATYEHEALRRRGLDLLSSVAVEPASEPEVESSVPIARFSFTITARIQELIGAKNTRAVTYRANMDGRPLWLALEAGTTFASTLRGNHFRRAVYQSAFDRTFLLDHDTKSVTELRTKQPRD